MSDDEEEELSVNDCFKPLNPKEFIKQDDRYIPVWYHIPPPTGSYGNDKYQNELLSYKKSEACQKEEADEIFRRYWETYEDDEPWRPKFEEDEESSLTMFSGEPPELTYITGILKINGNQSNFPETIEIKKNDMEITVPNITKRNFPRGTQFQWNDNIFLKKYGTYTPDQYDTIDFYQIAYNAMMEEYMNPYNNMIIEDYDLNSKRCNTGNYNNFLDSGLPSKFMIIGNDNTHDGNFGANKNRKSFTTWTNKEDTPEKGHFGYVSSCDFTSQCKEGYSRVGAIGIGDNWGGRERGGEVYAGDCTSCNIDKIPARRSGGLDIYPNNNPGGDITIGLDDDYCFHWGGKSGTWRRGGNNIDGDEGLGRRGAHNSAMNDAGDGPGCRLGPDKVNWGVDGSHRCYDAIRAMEEMTGKIETHYNLADIGSDEILASTATGAATGAYIGSVFPIVGTAIGAAVGASVGAISASIASATETNVGEEQCAAVTDEEFLVRGRTICSRDIDQYKSLYGNDGTPGINNWEQCCEGPDNSFNVRRKQDFDSNKGCYPTLYRHDPYSLNQSSTQITPSSMESYRLKELMPDGWPGHFYSSGCEDICLQPEGGALVNYPYGKLDTYRNQEAGTGVPTLCSNVFTKVHKDDPSRLDLVNFCSRKPAFGFPVEGKPNPDYEEICGCHYPKLYYDGTLDAMASDGGSAAQFANQLRDSGNECWNPKCKNSADSGYPKDPNWIPSSCPDTSIAISTCIQEMNIEPRITGSGTVNIDVEQLASCNATAALGGPSAGVVQQDLNNPFGSGSSGSDYGSSGGGGDSSSSGGDSTSSGGGGDSSSSGDDGDSGGSIFEFKCTIM